MVKVISFSLWGTNPKYCIGAIRNADLARKIYPGWVARFYCGSSVPDDIRIGILQHGNGWRQTEFKEDNFSKWSSGDGLTEAIFLPKDGDWRMMFDRFLPASDPDCEAMISRDCDSRLSSREKAAVDEWLASDRGFHIMRDHPWHGSQILGGMFGIKRGVLPDMLQLMTAWKQEDRWQTDQDFLNAVIYPRVANNSMVHASFFSIEPYARQFPTSRSGLEFVGQVFDENEVTVAEHLQALAKAL